jgi:hypothetical protein
MFHVKQETESWSSHGNPVWVCCPLQTTQVAEYALTIWLRTRVDDSTRRFVPGNELAWRLNPFIRPYSADRVSSGRSVLERQSGYQGAVRISSGRSVIIGPSVMFHVKPDFRNSSLLFGLSNAPRAPLAFQSSSLPACRSALHAWFRCLPSPCRLVEGKFAGMRNRFLFYSYGSRRRPNR